MAKGVYPLYTGEYDQNRQARLLEDLIAIQLLLDMLKQRYADEELGTHVIDDIAHAAKRVNQSVEVVTNRIKK